MAYPTSSEARCWWAIICTAYREGLVAAEFLSGKLKWQDKALGPSSVAYADGHLYMHAENGDAALVEATPEGYREKDASRPPDQPQRRNRGEKSWTHPVIANGRLTYATSARYGSTISESLKAPGNSNRSRNHFDFL